MGGGVAGGSVVVGGAAASVVGVGVAAAAAAAAAARAQRLDVYSLVATSAEAMIRNDSEGVGAALRALAEIGIAEPERIVALYAPGL